MTNKVDIVIQFMTITAGRAQQVEFTIPYYREGVGDVAHRVVFMDEGRIAEAGPPAEVLVSSQSPRLQSFLRRFQAVFG